MTKLLRLFAVCGVFLSFPMGAVWARHSVAAKIQYRWARMSIVHVLPSQVFARLGLTHTTRYGFTRDGYTKKTPDPTFPVGLTDIVPYDVTHLLLVRGTPQALAQFRQRVLATENEIVATGRWHIVVDLLSGKDGASVGPMAQMDVASDLLSVVSVGDVANPRMYRFRVHASPDGTAVVSCQAGLLPMPAGVSRAVVTPAQVWTPTMTRPVLPGGIVVFDDRASDRQSSRQRLNLPEEADARDYQIRVTVTPPPSVPVLGQVPSVLLPPGDTPDPVFGRDTVA